MSTYQRCKTHSQVLPALLLKGCWKQNCIPHILFFLVIFTLCNVFEYSANTSAFLTFLWVLGKAGSSQAAVRCGAAKVLRCISSAGIQHHQ